MEISLPTPKEQVLVQEVKKSITKLTIQRMVDLPAKKEVRVFVKELKDPVVLWTGEAYDEVGQWTDADVQAKLLELFS